MHTELGPGLLESVYHAALTYELQSRGIKAETEVPIPLNYKGIQMKVAYRADIIVEDEIILELKATNGNPDVFAKQLLTYLKLANKRIGLILNFNFDRMLDGVARIVNRLY